MTKIETIYGDRLLEEVSDQFAEMIRETISIIKNQLKSIQNLSKKLYIMFSDL